MTEQGRIWQNYMYSDDGGKTWHWPWGSVTNHWDENGKTMRTILRLPPKHYHVAEIRRVK